MGEGSVGQWRGGGGGAVVCEGVLKWSQEDVMCGM